MSACSVLLLDIREERRSRLQALLEAIPRVEVRAFASLERDGYEAGGFQVAVVHYGNPEAPFIEDGWVSEGTRVILFSGGFSEDCAEYEGVVYARGDFLEAPGNLQSLVSKSIAS